ncbi:MAG: cytidine deaminase [Candidatus Sericytochromatia bacterium]
MPVHHRVLKTELAIFDLPEELPSEDQALLEVARQATANSYSPYSNFKVGAAVRLANGQIISGSNQENIAYPSGLCAESICMFAAGAQFPAEAVVALAVTTVSGPADSDDLVTPCGVCRQVIAEYRARHDSPIRILMQGRQGPVVVVPDIQSLLPLMFEHGTLKKGD